MNKRLLKYSLIHALLAYAYIICIALFFRVPEKMFKNVPIFFGPIIMLSLFVLSAAVMAILIFGKPVLLYLDNQKKDALTMLFYTIGCLATIFILTVLFVLIVY